MLNSVHRAAHKIFASENGILVFFFVNLDIIGNCFRGTSIYVFLIVSGVILAIFIEAFGRCTFLILKRLLVVENN